MSIIQTISTDELDQRIQRGGAFQFWNVLTDEYFKGEMIVGSLRVPVDGVAREATLLGLPKNAEVVVYCSDKDCPFSGTAAEKLTTLGFTNVRAYKGGLAEWKASGRAVTKLVSLQAA